MSEPVVSVVVRKPLPKWVKWLGVVAVSGAVIFAIVSIVNELRRDAIRQAEAPAFNSIEQALIGFDIGGTANATWTVPKSQATFILLSPYCLSGDIEDHPELVGIVPPDELEDLAMKSLIEAPLLVGFRDGVWIGAQHIYSPFRWDGGMLIFRQGDQMSLQRTGERINVSITPQSK